MISIMVAVIDMAIAILMLGAMVIPNNKDGAGIRIILSIVVLSYLASAILLILQM